MKYFEVKSERKVSERANVLFFIVFSLTTLESWIIALMSLDHLILNWNLLLFPIILLAIFTGMSIIFLVVVKRDSNPTGLSLLDYINSKLNKNQEAPQDEEDYQL